MNNNLKSKIAGALNNPHAEHFITANSAIGLMALASVMLALTGFFESASRYESVLFWVDVVTTFFFTIEYGLRLWITDKKWKYAASPLGLLDLFSFVPTYLGLGSFGFLKAARFIRIARLSRVANLSNMPKVIPKKGDNESA